MLTASQVNKKGPVSVKVPIFHVYYHGQHEGMESFPEDLSIRSGNPHLTEEEARQQGGIGMKWVGLDELVRENSLNIFGVALGVDR